MSNAQRFLRNNHEPLTIDVPQSSNNQMTPRTYDENRDQL